MTKNRTRSTTKTVAIEKKMARMIMIRKNLKGWGMMCKWESKTWGDLATLEYGKALRGYQEAEGPYRVFGTNGPIGWHTEALCRHPSVVVGRKGAYRGIHYSEEPFWVIDTAFYLVPKSEFDMKWAYYELLTHNINAMDTGSAIPSTTRDAFYNLDVLLPPRAEQARIAHILGTLDDKIELNQRMNKTLEAMARAVFKSWFIDFDPVIDNAILNGKPIPDEFAACAEVRRDILARNNKGVAGYRHLFPDEFQDSPLGMIPKGWEVGCLGDIATRRHQTIKPEDIQDGTPYVALDDVPRGSIALTSWKAAEAIASSKSLFLQGDVLFGKLRPYFHKVVVAPTDGICSTDIVVIRAKQELWSPFVLLVCSSKEFVAYNSAVMTGTKMPRTNWRDMSMYEMALPPDDLLPAFQVVALPLVRQIVKSIHESRVLSVARDSLLPRLLSGTLEGKKT